MSSEIPGVDDIVDDTDDTDQTKPAGDEPVAAQARRQLVVPGNVMPWIEAAADEFGVPRDLLAAVIFQHSRFSGLNPSLVSQVAAALADSFEAVSATGRRSYPGEDEQNELELWLDAAANYAYGSTSSGAAVAYRKQIGKVYGPSRVVTGVKGGRGPEKAGIAKPVGVTLGTDVKLPAGKYQQARFPGGIGGGAVGGAGKAPLIPGLSDDDASAVQRIADPLFLKYLGRFPTNDEYRDLSKKRWTPQTLESHLRAQPVKDPQGKVVPGANLGRMADVRDEANRQAQAIEGRDATEEEVNYIITSGIPANNIGAYYQQVHDHAVWHGDPTKWRDAQKRAQSIWDRLGLTGDVDPQLVNEIVDGNLTDAQFGDRVRALPAPGYGQGVTVGEVDRLRTVAAGIKRDLFPGESVSDAELHHLVGMSPEDMLHYYRSIVPGQSKTGLPVGVEKDYRAMAESVLAKYGVTGYELTPEDLKFFALTQADPQAMLEHFAANPKIVAAHPGLAYGMQSEDFHRAVGDLTGAYQGAFPGQAIGNALPYGPQTKDASLLGVALTDKIAPGEFGDVLERFREERGRAPTATEFRERRARPTTPRQPGGGFPESTPTPREREPAAREARPAVGGRA